MVGAFAIHQFFFSQKPFTALAIETGVVAQVYVALVVHLLQDVLYRPDVQVISGPDKIVRFDVQRRPGVPEQGTDAVNVFPGWYAICLGCFDNLVAMFIGAGLKAHILLAEPPEAAVSVSQDGCIGVAQVRLGVHIINRGGYIKAHFSFAVAVSRAVCHSSLVSIFSASSASVTTIDSCRTL